jgi:ABC-type antimicrobial peptide transport system permease subunit
MSVRVRGNPATLVARLPIIAADANASLYVQEARTLGDWIHRRDMNMLVSTGALVGTTSLVLFLSALGIYSLMSVTVSRRTREIGLRAALGARPRDVLAGTLSRAAVLMGSGVFAGGFLLLLFVAVSGDRVALYAGFLAVTAAVIMAAALLASIVPARRALRINPTEALREA